MEAALLTVEIRQAVHPDHAARMGTEELRRHFLASDLFRQGEVRLVYSHYDRFTVGGCVPAGDPLTLGKVEETRTPNFLDRREMGVVNIGADGTVSVGGVEYAMGHGDVLYIGMGSGPVTFAGAGRYYITSAPAHRALPTRLVRLSEANKMELGEAAAANRRTINQFIHPTVMESCQLVLGYTSFEPGSVWNTMPAHVHDRRMEAYLYFEMDAASRVLHLMGEPTETRHIFVADEEAVLSPPWSIHSGAGTGRYAFVWAMAGDNVDYTDMDFVEAADLR